MKDLYPEYADKVTFYAVGTDPNESLERLEAYRESQEYPWPMAFPGAGMLPDFRVITQSTKVAFDGQGIITYRDGYGGGGEETWRKVFEGLISQ